MRAAIFTGQFRRDVKLAEKRGKDIEKLQRVISLILVGDALPTAYRDHPLKGEWKPGRDLHIEPDWVLIYTVDGNAVRFDRTGTHADLFGK